MIFLALQRCASDIEIAIETLLTSAGSIDKADTAAIAYTADRHPSKTKLALLIEEWDED